MTGTFAEWESWTDMVFPNGRLCRVRCPRPVDIDRAKDIGAYVEEGPWVQHP
jgi:hypothetical protein